MDAIHVIATSDADTRAAITDAVRRACLRRTSVVVWIPRLLAESMDDDAAGALPSLVGEYKRLIADLGGTGTVRVCLCHAMEQLMELAGR